MKVFISWSGERSKKIAEILKVWIKQVIQSTEPFISSQDISSGVRWSADLAKELQDTNFGILCVTKDNFQAPWLLFEAGALSKSIEESFVVPLLFDLKPSDLSKSPLLQFQATSFSKEEIKKLMDTMNEASDNKLDAQVFDKSFERWYTDLENDLREIGDNVIENTDDTNMSPSEKSLQVLEEILALSRDNQKLLRNPESRPANETEQIVNKLDQLIRRKDRNEILLGRSGISREQIMELSDFSEHNKLGREYGILIMLSMYKDDYPWVYDAGKELLSEIKSNKPYVEKERLLKDFVDLIEFTSYYFIERGVKRGQEAEVYRYLQFELERISLDLLHKYETI